MTDCAFHYQLFFFPVVVVVVFVLVFAQSQVQKYHDQNQLAALIFFPAKLPSSFPSDLGLSWPSQPALNDIFVTFLTLKCHNVLSSL